MTSIYPDFLEGMLYAARVCAELAEEYDIESEDFYVDGALEQSEDWHALVHASSVASECKSRIERRILVARNEGRLVPVTLKSEK